MAEQEHLHPEESDGLEPAQTDAQNMDDYFTIEYDWLRARARSILRGERKHHTLAPTELVHEIFKLAKARKQSWTNYERFRSWAHISMKRFLIDYARKRTVINKIIDTVIAAGSRSAEYIDSNARETNADREQYVEVLNRALEKLSKEIPEAYQILILVEIHQLTYREAAQRAARSERSAYNYHKKAIESLEKSVRQAFL